MALFKRRLHGIKVPHRKNTMSQATELMGVPDVVYITMSQHIGAPCKPLVAVGDQVAVGQLIGDTDAFVSAPIHSSVSGKVTAIEDILSSLGTMDKTVVIKSDKKQTVCEGIRVPQVNTREEFIKAVRDSGLVGLGGAAFPTHIKYNPKNIAEVKTLVINGAECEPYITSDYRTMLEDGPDVVEGIQLLMKHLTLDHCYIGIEDNKPEAITHLTRLTEEMPEITIVALGSKYPKGAERVLIYETTGKALPPGKLPAEIGVIVSNVTSVAFLGQYFRTGMPLIQKRITVDGDAVSTPKNLMVLIGTQIFEIIDFCGGYKSPPKKVIMGGPMMGRAIYHDGNSLIKHNNAILALSEEAAYMEKETPCINCGRCTRACPLMLMPTLIAKAYENGDMKGLQKHKVSICMECGSCSYVCPAKRQLNMINRLAKAKLKEAETNGKI